MAQRITRLTTDQKIAGSNPAEFEIHFIVNQIRKIIGTAIRYLSKKMSSTVNQVVHKQMI